MTDAEDPLEFVEGGVGMLFDVGLEFLRVEFAPVTPGGLGGELARAGGVEKAVNRAAADGKAAGCLGFGPSILNEFDHPFA